MRYAGNYWKSKDELIKKCSSIDPYSLTGQCLPISKYLHQLSTDIGCNLEDLPVGMVDRHGWRGRDRDRRHRKRERQRQRETERERERDRTVLSVQLDK